MSGITKNTDESFLKKRENISYVKDWCESVNDEQQEMLGYFGEVDWDRYNEDELNVLEDKLNLLIYGLAQDQLQDEKEEEKSKKQEAERKRIEKETKDRELFINELCDIIVREGTRQFVMDVEEENNVPRKKCVYMVYIFVFWKDLEGNCGCWPVFRVPKDDTGETATFIDMSKRVYSDWKDFLENNQFPACEYCYPRNGKYYSDKDGVAVDFGKSPAANTSQKVLNGLDITSAAVGAAATVVTLASLTALPIAAPILAGTAWASGGVSGYTLFRSCNFLYDRSLHKQNIGFRDREARGCYISILATTVGFGASAATSLTVKAVQNGRVLGRIAQGAVTALNGGALVMNGVGMVNSLEHLVKKHGEQQLTTLDVAQFSASLLLFCHATANFKTARTIIENTQNDCIQDFRNGLRSNKHKKSFNKLVKNTVKNHGNTDGKALVIRSVKKIDNVNDFFEGIVRTEKPFRYVKNKVAFADNGNIKIDGKATVDPRQLRAMNKNERVNFLRAAQKYGKNKMSDAKFKSISDAVFKDLSNSTPIRTMPARGMYNNPLNYLKENFPFFPAFLSGAQEIELTDMLKYFPVHYQKIILQLTNFLFTHFNDEYMDVAHFVCNYVKDLLNLCVEGYKKYILKVFSDRLHRIPAEEMDAAKFCLALLQEFLLQPKILQDILCCVKSFCCVLLDSTPVFQSDGQINYLELVSVANMLLKTERWQWDQISEISQQIFHAFGFKKVSSLIAIARELCLYIEKAVIDMQKRYQYDSNTIIDDDDDDTDCCNNSQRDNDLNIYYIKAIESLNDKEIYDSLIKRIQEETIHLQ